MDPPEFSIAGADGPVAHIIVSIVFTGERPLNGSVDRVEVIGMDVSYSFGIGNISVSGQAKEFLATPIPFNGICRKVHFQKSDVSRPDGKMRPLDFFVLTLLCFAGLKHFLGILNNYKAIFSPEFPCRKLQSERGF